MLRLMQKYNKLIARWKDAENYQKSEKVFIADKVKHVPNLIILHDEILATADEIREKGYAISADESENGFRQIQFL